MKILISVLALLVSTQASAEGFLKTVLDTKGHRVGMEVDIKLAKMFCGYGDGLVVYLSKKPNEETIEKRPVHIPTEPKVDALILELSKKAREMHIGFPLLIYEDGKMDLNDMKDIAKVSADKVLFDKIEALQKDLKEICDKHSIKD